MFGKRFGRFTAWAVPFEARGRRLVLVSPTQVDSVVPTVPDSRDAVQVDKDGEAEVVGESDTESNRTVPATGREEDVVDGGLEVEHHDSVCQANTTTCSDAGSVNGVGFEDVAHSENQLFGWAIQERHAGECLEREGTKFNRKGDGNSFCYFPECCCTGLSPEAG